jgi:hypothetical protein
VTWPNGTKTCTAVLRDDSWSLNVPENLALQTGETITAVQNCCNKTPSDPASTIVQL